MENKLLDTWTYSAKEWSDFIITERSNKKSDNLYFGVGILLLGIPGLMLFRAVPFLMAALFVVPFALLIPFIRYKMSKRFLQPNIEKPNVQLYHDFIISNGVKKEIFSKKYWLKNVKIITSKHNRSLLEFDVAWNTRRGSTNDEFRILIPKDKLAKAEEIIDFYKNY